MTARTDSAQSPPHDWWQDDEKPAAPSVRTAAPAEHIRGGGRLPDWRTGQTVDLGKPDTDNSTATDADTDTDSAGPAAPCPDMTEQRGPAATTSNDEPDEYGDQEDTEASPDGPAYRGWEPLAIAASIHEALRRRSLTERAQAAAHAATTPPQTSRNRELAYLATGIWVAWRLGLTPWLLHTTRTTPVLVPVTVCVAGWLLDRRTRNSAGPIAWAGRAVFTATVIALTPHL